MSNFESFISGIVVTLVVMFITAAISSDIIKNKNLAILEVMNQSCERIEEIEYNSKTYRLMECGEESRIIRLYVNP